MATYNNVITRSDAAALIPEDVAADIIKRLPQTSAALALFRHVTMSRAQQRMPVMAALPVAFFVNGDTGLKQTTEAGWTNQYLNVEEIACIVPVPEAVLDDTAFDIWAETRPFMTEAVGRALDAAVFFGVNKPATWPTALVTAATAAGNVVTRGTATADEGGVMGDVSALFSEVEDDGFDVNGLIAQRTFKGLFRNARATTGQQLDGGEGANPATNNVYGVDVTYPLRGLWPTGPDSPEMIAGDFTQGILGIRQDLTWKLLDQAVINDDTGKIIYNLPQQDMLALRVVARFAWTVAETPTPENVAGAFPFAVMQGAEVTP
jgi:HK97 family phage major capsid protein